MKERAARMALEHQEEHGTQWSAINNLPGGRPA